MGTVALGVFLGLVVLGFVTRFVVGRNRLRELDRDFSIELSCARERALRLAANAARGVMWQVQFNQNGLFTRHINAHNVIHVAVSEHPGRPGRSTAKVWVRARLADGMVFQRPKAYLDTRRKRDKIVRMLSSYRMAPDTDAALG
jgi:hypothetical protein